MNAVTLQPGCRQGTVEVPWSKSHLHRLLIADALSGGTAYQTPLPGVAEDVLATCRCLEALMKGDGQAVLPCGESGSTLRFMLPVAMTQVDQAVFTAEGRLPQRPIAPFLEMLGSHGVVAVDTPAVFPLRLAGKLQAGEYSIRGDISSQIITGLLLALPILPGESRIRWTTPLQSRGYVDMTLQVIREYGIVVRETQDGFMIPGNQQYRRLAAFTPERDWSGAAFWLAMNKLGSRIDVPGMSEKSCQPDRGIVALLEQMGGAIDVSQCPDIFPVLAAVAGATAGDTAFVGVKRLRLKESDRLAAMADVLSRLGVETTIDEDRFTVHGIGPHLRGNVAISPWNDHRIAMAAAVAATVAQGPVTIESPECTGKSYPGFFEALIQLHIEN